MTDASLAVATGYGASKFVAENVLAQARASGVECTTLRVGQVCGSTGAGAWGTSEWVPIMVKSCAALGMVPALDGVGVPCRLLYMRERLTVFLHAFRLALVVDPH